MTRLMGALHTAWRHAGRRPEMIAIASRGAGPVWLSAVYLPVCLLRIAWGTLLGRVALVHVNVASRGSCLRKFIVIAVARLLRRPVVLHLHGGGFRSFYEGLTPLAQRAVRWMFGTAARVLVLGEVWREFVCTALGVPNDRVIVLPNAVADPLRGASARPDAQAPPLVCFLGRLADGKGVPILLQALADPAVRKHDFQAVLAGDGDIARYREQARQLGLSDRVNFVGWLDRSAVAELYRNSDIFVLPSHAEGLSVALLEAMAYGLAVVATPVGAQAEVIEDGINGLLVAPGDRAALAAALDRLLVDEDARRSLGANARTRFLERYEIGRCVEMLERVYRDVLDEARAS